MMTKTQNVQMQNVQMETRENKVTGHFEGFGALPCLWG